jgi:predicted GNAT family acetyltransferase
VRLRLVLACAALSLLLCRSLLERVPRVCLFVRPENTAAIRVYDGIGMRRTISYRSLVF